MSKVTAAAMTNGRQNIEDKLRQNVVEHIPITIPEQDLTAGALQVLAVIRSTWNQQDIDFKLLTDGITNKLVACFLREDVNKKDVVLVRVYGNKTDLLIDRKTETRNIILLHRANLAPRLYATFENGLSYEYVSGSTLSEEMLQDEKICQLVAAKVAQLHKVRVPGKPLKPMIWTKMHKFYKLIPDQFSDPIKQKKFQEIGVTKIRILEEMVYLQEHLEKVKSPIVFCHNDLLLGNVIYTKEEDKVTFIDFEYSDYNYQAFDIGNHFAEFVGLGDIDYAKYPSEEVQKKWLRKYMAESKSKEGVTPDKIDDYEVEELYIQVNKFSLASHMLWGLWSLIQAEHSYLEFDFLKYFSTRFAEYLKRRDEFLSMRNKYIQEEEC